MHTRDFAKLTFVSATFFSAQKLLATLNHSISLPTLSILIGMNRRTKDFAHFPTWRVDQLIERGPYEDKL